jgi:hypothetical protein
MYFWPAHLSCPFPFHFGQPATWNLGFFNTKGQVNPLYLFHPTNTGFQIASTRGAGPGPGKSYVPMKVFTLPSPWFPHINLSGVIDTTEIVSAVSLTPRKSFQRCTGTYFAYVPVCGLFE